MTRVTWSIPAKTFLLGEYAALHGGPAIVLTTTPCFDVGLSHEHISPAIHPDSPAGLFWKKTGISSQLTWNDPYHGIGGLGASSAQFLGAYWAEKSQPKSNPDALLEAYWACSWQAGQGVRPSGYDVLAQAASGCVYINNHAVLGAYAWPFTDMAFILLHTGDKLATHHHLQDIRLTEAMTELSSIALSGHEAFLRADSTQLIKAVQAYHEALTALDLVAERTKQQLANLAQDQDVLACKGCGAMGADVLFVLVPSQQLLACKKRFDLAGWAVLATSNDLYVKKNEKNTNRMPFTP
jgi:mevalonate kinase